MLSIHLRPYRTTDLPSLYLLDRVCFEPPFRFSRSAMRQFAEAENAIVRLANETAAEPGTERLAGFCIVHLEQAGENLVAYVVTLDVEPAFRRQGVGPMLMQSVEKAARDAGAQSMVLHVWTGNEQAIRLYERLGYRFCRKAEDFYGEGLDALVYRKPLVAGGAGPGTDARDKSGEWSAFGGPGTDAS